MVTRYSKEDRFPVKNGIVTVNGTNISNQVVLPLLTGPLNSIFLQTVLLQADN